MRKMSFKFFGRTDDGAGPAAAQADDDIGTTLREARQRKGVDLETAARDLKIRADYLAALEENDHAVLPGLPYVAGFVRSYAAYVGLDAEHLVRQLKGDTEKREVKTEYAWLTPVREGRLSGTLVFILSLLMAAAAYAGWYYQSMDDRRPAAAADAASAREAAPIVAAAAGAAREVPKATVRRRDDARKPAVGRAKTPDVRSDAQSGARSASGAAPKKDVVPGRAGTVRPDRQAADAGRKPGGGTPDARKPAAGAAPPSKASRLDAGDDALDAGVGEEGKPAVKPVSVDDQTITLKALGAVWMRVRNPLTRRVLAERIMKKGDILKLPKQEGLVLDVGRANQIEIIVGGKSAGVAGRSGRPRRNVSLDPGRLKPDG